MSGSSNAGSYGLDVLFRPDRPDAARKAAATFSIFAAVSMLIGAFIASVAAAYGGNLRDEY